MHPDVARIETPVDAICAICGAGSDICLDHDHKTGHFRGWLCRGCNWTLGLWDDDLAKLRRAVTYLEESEVTLGTQIPYEFLG